MRFILEFFLPALGQVVSWLMDDLVLSDYQYAFSMGDFLVALAILSIAIGALVTQLRGFSLTHEAGVYRQRQIRSEIQSRHAPPQKR